MKEQGVDLIDCSSGALVQADINVFPGYQVSFAEKIREQAEIATGAVGLITTGTMAEEILQNNRADLIFVARELLRDPHFARSAAKQLNTEIPSPVNTTEHGDEVTAGVFRSGCLFFYFSRNDCRSFSVFPIEPIRGDDSNESSMDGKDISD